jgi:hypothetical protein
LGTRFVGDGHVRYNVKLVGQCDLVQTNFVFSKRDGEHYGYYPLLCGNDTSEPCRVVISAAGALLHPTKYDVKLVLAERTDDESHKVLEWEMGGLDFRGAEVSSNKDGRTPDQQEDVFEKIHEEMRPPFEMLRKRTNVLLAITFGVIVVLPWIYLFAMWGRLGVLSTPMKNIWALTLFQKIFYLLFIAWFGLAMANWAFLDTFMTLKIGASLILPTWYFGLVGLRQAITTKSSSIKAD